MRWKWPCRGFQGSFDRHGKPRCYHRKSRTPVDCEKFPPGSMEYYAECYRIDQLYKKADVKPGTLGMLIAAYRAHTQFQDLAPRTQADYQRIFDYLKPIADTPLKRFNPPLVVKIRDRAAGKLGRKWGNYTKTVLSVIFGWGVERGFVHSNPAFKIKGIRKPKGAPEANRPWLDEEREAVLAALPAHMVVPISLMMYCGLDPKDALQLPRSAIKDGLIDTKRAKTSQPVWIPLPAPMAEALKAAPRHDAITVCANSFGRPWTVDGFGASWKKVRQKLLDAGAISPGLTLKGLRHTVATILSEMRVDSRTIADMLGQRTTAMADLYSRRKNLTTKLTPVSKDLGDELNRRRAKIVKPDG